MERTVSPRGGRHGALTPRPSDVASAAPIAARACAVCAWSEPKARAERTLYALTAPFHQIPFLHLPGVDHSQVSGREQWLPGPRGLLSGGSRVGMFWGGCHTSCLALACVDLSTLPPRPPLSRGKRAVRKAATRLQVPLLWQPNEKVGLGGVGGQGRVSQDEMMRTPVLV